MSQPVLIYISKDSCGACKVFNAKEWESLKYRLNGKARFVSFRIKDSQRVPEAIEAYAQWFPSIILTSAANYNKYFSDDDKLTSHRSGTLPAVQYNSVEEKGKIIPAGRPSTADAIVNWFDKASKKL